MNQCARIVMGALMLAGCGGGTRGDAPDGIVVTDSAGIGIVDNLGPTRTLPVREILRFGLVDGDPDLLFDAIRTIAIDDSSIWVSDSHASLRRYSMDGEYLAAVGGLGEGPGESPRGYGDIWLSDSTIYVLSYSPSLQLFTTGGAFLGARMPFTPAGVSVLPLGPVEGGWLFYRQDLPAERVAGARGSWTVLRGPATAMADDSLLTLPGGPQVPSGNSWSNGSYFDGFPSISSGGDGSVYYSDASDYRISQYSGDGRLQSIIRRSIRRTPYEADIEGEIRSGLESAWRTTGFRPDEAGRRRQLQAALPTTNPTWLPAIDLVLASRDGSFWVRRADQHPDPAMRAVARVFGYIPSAWLAEWRADWVFDLFGPDGAYVGTVSLPFDFVPMAVSGGTVFGSIRDDLDVEYVTAFFAGSG